MNPRVEKALNDQIQKEASSSQYYLAMDSWSEANGLGGTAKFMYAHSDEERFHMLKLIKFVNERGGRAEISEISNINKNDAEYHLFKNKPEYYSLHNSTVNHYHQRYQFF